DRATNILSVRVDVSRVLGIGTGVDVLTTPVTTVFTTTAGDATHNAIQLLTVGNANGGTYRLIYASPVQICAPFNASTCPAPLTATALVGGGSLAAGNYFYKVTAVTNLGETIRSPQVTPPGGGSTRAPPV